MKQALTPDRQRLWHALAVVALLLAGRLAQSIHDAESGHRVCPEHGELLHVAHDLDDELLAGGEEHGPLVRAARGPAGHDHCWLADWFTSAETSWAPDASPTVAVASLAAKPPRVVSDVRHVRAPLSFAPKHSPPSGVI